MKEWLSRCSQTKEKQLLRSFYTTHLMWSLVLLLTISFQLVASYSICLPSLLVFTSLWSLHFYTVYRFYRNHVKGILGNFKDLVRVGLVVLKKIIICLKIPKWQRKLVWDYKWGKLVSYFLNNAAKSCVYGLKISDNVEIEHVFHSKAFFILVAIFTQVASVP